MTVQGVLFLLGVLLLVAAAICAGAAAFLYFKKDIQGIRDDLSGKKRAKAIAEMDEESPSNRRRARANASPASAAAAAAASVARNAQAVDMDDVQATAGPKPQSGDAAGQGASGAATNPARGSSRTQAVGDDASTIVTGGDESATIVSPAAGSTQDDTTTVVSSAAEEAVAKTKPVEAEPKDIKFQVVRKIVLAESADFVR